MYLISFKLNPFESFDDYVLAIRKLLRQGDTSVLASCLLWQKNEEGSTLNSESENKNLVYNSDPSNGKCYRHKKYLPSTYLNKIEISVRF